MNCHDAVVGNRAMARLMAMVMATDRMRARVFYRDILGPILKLGSPVVDDFGDQFPCGDGFIRVTTLPDWLPTSHPALGWQVPDVTDCCRRLTSAGVTILIYPGMGQDDLGVWIAPAGGARIAWFNNSEGNLLSIAEQH